MALESALPRLALVSCADDYPYPVILQALNDDGSYFAHYIGWRQSWDGNVLPSQILCAPANRATLYSLTMRSQ